MMTEYAEGLCWRCDSCGLETEDFPRTGGGSVVEAVAELRQRGWLIGRLRGGVEPLLLLAQLPEGEGREVSCRCGRAARSTTAKCEVNEPQAQKGSGNV